MEKVQSKYINSNWEDDSINKNNQEGNLAQGTHSSSGSTEERTPREKPSVGHILIPYIQGLGKSFKKSCGKYGVQTHFNGNRTLKQLQVKSKDQDPKEKQSGVIYRYQCGEIMCNEEYIGRHPGLLGNDTGNTQRNPLPSMCTAYKLDTIPHQTISIS